MVDFRRWIIAAAVLTLFVGLASAQVPGNGGSGSLVCTASVAVPPQLRSEGLTELLGDIVLTCTGGTALPNGSIIPTANITVSLGTAVTSRLISGSVSDALLMIDEPGSGLPAVIGGTGPQAPQNLCLVGGAASLNGAGPGGCVQIVNNLAVPAPGSGTVPVMTGVAGVAAANMYLGIVQNNQVIFNGIPILAPVTSGTARVFRITNVRANVAGLGGGGLPGTTQLLASITISGSTALPVNNPTPVAGFVQSGLTTSLRNANNTGGLSGSGASFNQCNTVNVAGGVAVLQYTENFGTAFKTRVAPTPINNNNGQTGVGSALQNVPGTIYNSESGFVIPQGTQGFTGGVVTSQSQIGLADYGTRLKAVFNNIQPGVRLFVSSFNLVNNTTNATIVPPATNSTSSFAVLVNGEATPDGNGSVPALPTTFALNSISGAPGITAAYELQIVGGSATAVWEVVNTNPSALETFNFGVWTAYSANPGNNSPAIGTSTVNMSYAPTPPVPFSSAAGSAASSSLTVPRFADTSTARSLMAVNICQTLLLFPFVTNLAGSGFDTGLAIANTSTDPIGTTVQTGTCKLTWYDGTGKFPATGINGTDLTKEAAVATGTVAVNLVSTLAPGFSGYMMALCNFQYAHGFAFISDIGARNLAMGYLALVVNNGAISRPNAPASETLGN